MDLAITASSLRERVEEILPKVARPARYMGGELNSVHKPAQEVNARIALAFPDTYEVGMSNLGLRILYHVLNSESGVAAERVFAPASDMEKEMRDAGVPLFSLESSLPLRSFDLVGFSLAYELCYTTVLNMLDLAGIPIHSRDRTASDPIIIAGGHCATNPEPMADFIDAFAIGDGEDVVLDIARTYVRHRGDRAAALAAMAAIEGVYVPSVHGDEKPVVTARRVLDLEHAAFPESLVVPFAEAVHDRVTLEIMRGCSRGCRFCQAGMITRPVRERSLETLCEQAEMLLEKTGYEEIALTSLSSADHSQISELVRTLIDRHESDRVGISLPSLRADAACVDLAAQIQRVRKSGLTFAPEAGTQRLRDVINKNVTETDLLGAVEAAVEQGWRRIKLYFMIGLPTETDEDLQGIGNLVSKVIDVGRRNRAPLTLNVTISPFVPKPHTPFQWRGMLPPEELDRRIAVVRPLLRAKNIQLSWHAPASSRVEAALARGDRSLGQVVYEAWRRGGVLEQDNFDRVRWDEAFDAAGVDIAFFANRDIPIGERLPWDHIDVGVTRRFLALENERAERGETTPDCRTGDCSGCGVRAKLGGAECPPARSGFGNPARESAPASPSPAGEGRGEVSPSPDRPHARAVLTFRKAAEVRWLGHLDLLRVFERAVRMSGVDIVYSQGFNPRPRMSIASALPLGATADADIAVFQIHTPIDLKDVISRLNKSLPEGVRMTAGRALHENAKPPVIAASQFDAELEVPEGPIDLQTAVDAMMDRAEIEWLRESPKGRRRFDLRGGIDSLQVCGSACIRMLLPHREFTVKPSEVVEALALSLPGLKLRALHRSSLLTADSQG